MLELKTQIEPAVFLNFAKPTHALACPLDDLDEWEEGIIISLTAGKYSRCCWISEKRKTLFFDGRLFDKDENGRLAIVNDAGAYYFDQLNVENPPEKLYELTGQGDIFSPETEDDFWETETLMNFIIQKLGKRLGL